MEDVSGIYGPASPFLTPEIPESEAAPEPEQAPVQPQPAPLETDTGSVVDTYA